MFLKPNTFMTRGFSDLMAVNTNTAKWSVKALQSIRTQGELPDMVIGENIEKETLEDEGRTLILPLHNSPKCYAVLNEVGGATLMLASEY